MDDRNLNASLERGVTDEVKPLTDAQIEKMIPQYPGERITNRYNLIPATPPKDPKEGDMYYDKTLKKLRIYTGFEFETVNSE